MGIDCLSHQHVLCVFKCAPTIRDYQNVMESSHLQSTEESLLDLGWYQQWLAAS